MAKKPIATVLLGRKVKLGWNMPQMNAWAKDPANKDQALNCKIVPAAYARHGQQEGTIVSVYTDGKGNPAYTIERDGDLMELSPQHHFDILPAEKKE